MQLQIFKFQSPEERQLSEIRTVEIDGEIWFVGSDVAKTLGYAKPSNAINSHCKQRGTLKQGIPTKGGVQEVTIINEANVYRLILRSQLPSAERFEEWVFEDVIPSIRKKGFYGKIDRTALPNFIERYKDNYHKLPNTHFSVISEMYARLYLALEKVGYMVPDRGAHGRQMMPDISVGRGFAAYLKSIKSPFYGSHSTYKHSFPDGREVDANMYHVDALPIFIKYIHEHWIPNNAEGYFRGKDPMALEYLPKLLGAG